MPLMIICRTPELQLILVIKYDHKACVNITAMLAITAVVVTVLAFAQQFRVWNDQAHEIAAGGLR